MGGGVRPVPDWPPPDGLPPNGPGALDRARRGCAPLAGWCAPPLGWLAEPGHLGRDWEGTTRGPFAPFLAQPDAGRAVPSSDRGGRSSGGGVRPGAPFAPAPRARPMAAAPAPGLTVWSGVPGPASALPSAGMPPAPGAAAAAPARAPAVPAVAPAVATCAAR